MKVAKKFVISGRVQGVGFRFFAERAASQLGLTGYAKNKWDGTVEIYAMGEAAGLEEFKRLVSEGPRSARVENVQETDEPVDPQSRRFLIG